jgi:hypothetical protein
VENAGGEIMEKNIPQKRGILRAMLSAWGILLVAVICAAGFIAPVSAEDSVSVSCYNLEKSQHPLGSVVVYDTSRAAMTCNSVYYDCKGRCIGCFSDSDYLDAVCVDVRGTIFLK